MPYSGIGKRDILGVLRLGHTPSLSMTSQRNPRSSAATCTMANRRALILTGCSNVDDGQPLAAIAPYFFDMSFIISDLASGLPFQQVGWWGLKVAPTEIRANPRSSAAKIFSCEQKLFRAQIFDRIAQLGCFFKLEALGGLAHVALKFGDVGVQLFLRFKVRDSIRSINKVRIVGLHNLGQRHIQRPDNALRGNAVFLVVSPLQGAAAISFIHRFLHGISNAIGVENRSSVEVARAAAHGLNQRTRGTQEALFIGIENGDE